MIDQPLILFKVPKQGVVAIIEIPCQELVTPGSQLLSRKPSKEEQPARKVSNLSFIFSVISAGSSSTSKKVMWQQEIQKEDSQIPEMVYLDIGCCSWCATNLSWICFALHTTRLPSTKDPKEDNDHLTFGESTLLLNPPKCKNNLENIILLVPKSML